MKKISLLTLICLAITTISFAKPTAREKVLFNFDWKFKKGDAGLAFHIYLDESDWEDVQLPHDASVSGEFSRENSTRDNGWLPYGKGWYRKHFKVNEDANGKKIFISFEGVYRDAEIYLNGVYLGRHLNGYLGFEHDITDLIHPGEENVIAVSYDNTTKGTSRWYTGEGIYRDVWLTITDKLHIPQYGTYITTPSVSEKNSLVRIETNVINGYEKKKMTKLITEIYDPHGRKITESVSIAPLQSGENYTFIQEISVQPAILWSCDNPNLYKAVSKVYSGDILADEYETPFGIREIRMTPGKGLLLNGKKLVAKGGNMHHDLGCLGSAALEKGYERKLIKLKEMGCNSIRLSHNPHAPVLLNVADRLGFLVFNEAFDKWTSQYYGRVESFEDNWQKDLTSFIKRDRNHPSVYIWSMGNEVLKQEGRHDSKFETPAAASDYGVGLYQRMVEFTRSLDPTRKVTVGLFPAREKFIKEWEHLDDYEVFKNSLPAEMAFYGDVVSWNYTENMFEYDHERHPQLMFIASETGTNLVCGPDRKNSWLEMDTSYVIGHYYWSATDYLGESDWPTKVWGRALLDITDKMTPIGYLYQSFYSDKPMVHIMVREEEGQLKEWFDKKEDNIRWDWYPVSDHWNRKGENASVQIFTNAEEVELFLNGKSLGKKKFMDKYQTHLEWEVPYEKGELKAVARNKGKKVAEHALKTAAMPVKIQLDPDVKTLNANGLDLAYVEVSLVDKDGVIVPDADHLLNFEVEGEGILAGVANGDIFSDEPWVAPGRTTYKGKCLVVIRSTLKKGKVVLRVTGEGLAGETIEIQCI
jgi:beta-galactosidase